MALKEKFTSYYRRFLQVLPMDDAYFVGDLIAGGMLPGDTKAEIRAKATTAQKAETFMDRCIEPSFSDDGTENPILKKLLKIMEDSGFPSAKELAEEFSKDDATPGIPSLTSKPTFTQLKDKFKEVADWESICPYLINDDTGQSTIMIRRNNMDVEGRRDEMLRRFLQQTSPTWEKVIAALRAGRYNNLADSIERELQG